MVRIGVRPRLPPARHRAYEHASSRVAAVQSGPISLKQPAEMPGLQPQASGAPARRRIPTAAARRQCRCDHCPPPSPAAGSKHKPEPSALLAHYNAICRAKRERSPNRKLQMLLSAQRQTHESLLRRGRKAARLLDMGWVHPRSEEHTSELQSQSNLVCRLLLEKKNDHIRSSDATIIASPHPKFTGGLDLSLPHRDLDVSATLIVTFGNMIFNSLKYLYAFRLFD